MAELLPCPFCGGSAEAYHAFPQFDEGWHVSCEHADDCILVQAHGMMPCEASAEKMAGAWNRRAAAPQSHVVDILCDCERGANGLGIAGRDCDCAASKTHAEDLRKRLMRAIFDPGATEGFKGDRDLTTWQTDAVMRVLGFPALASEGQADAD